MKKLTEGISAKDVFRGAETLFAQGADPNAVGTDVDTGKSVHMLAGLLYGPSDWLNCSMVRVEEFWNWDVGAEFRISIKKPELQGLRP